MAEQFGEKSQEATPHRRQQAREQGQVAKSQDLSSAVMLISALMILLYYGRGMVDFLGRLAHKQLGEPPQLEVDADFLVNQWKEVVTDLGWALAPLLGFLLLAAVLVNLAQVGFLFLPDKLSMDITRIDPLKGVQRLFSLTNLVKLILGIFKIMVVAAVAAWSLWSEGDVILGLSGLEIPQIAAYVANITIWTCLKIGAALLILAILDYAYQKWKHEQDLKMTSQEVREEMKNLQGDPQIIARRRAIQRQMVLNRLNSDVPNADVVVTNPTELAIAIKYEYETMPAPIVVAKGAGVLAQRIRRLALENSIPVVERKELARLLYANVDIGAQVPAEEYAAVAEVLRYVYDLKGKSIPGMSDAA